MFKRDEVYDVLLQLTGQAMLRLLKNSSGDAPGASNSNTNDNTFGPFISSPDNHQQQQQLFTNKPMPSKSTDNRLLTNPLKHDLAAQKRNMDYCLHFKLPLKEQLLDALEVGYTLNNGSGLKSKFSHSNTPSVKDLHGRVYISETFLAYESQQRLPQPQQHQPIVWLVFPLYTIKRVERLNSGSYKSSLSITTYHNMEHIFKFHVSVFIIVKGKKKDVLDINCIYVYIYNQALKPAVESFCQLLRDNLKAQTSSFKLLKPFLATCESEKMFEPKQQQTETLLVDVTDPSTNDEKGGLGLKFGFPGDSRQSKDRTKLKLWKQYFMGKLLIIYTFL